MWPTYAAYHYLRQDEGSTLAHRATESPEGSITMSEPQPPGPDAPSEPLLAVGALSAAAAAIIAVVVAFFTPVSDDQQSAILGLVAVLAPFIVALAGRAKVWSPASVRAALLAARAAPAKRTMPYTRVSEPDVDVRDLP